MSSIASKSVKGIVWSAVEKFSLQGIQFLIGVVLARLLSPSDFGLIGMLSIFLSVSQTFIDCGFSNALIRQKETSEKDYSTAFSLNFLISLLAFGILFVFAPFVAEFYEMPELKDVMRWVSLTLVINALFTVHKVRLTRAVDFKTQSKASFASAIISGVLGISLAYKGFGVWSLVVQSICNSSLNLILLTVLLKWFPKPGFQKKSFKELFGFGSKILIASLIHSVYSNLYNIVIGKRYSASDLGYFTRADQLGKFPSMNVSGILSRVTLPILSQLQDEPQRLKTIYEKYLRLTCFVCFPLMLGLAALAEPVVVLLLGAKWQPSIVLLQILCFGLMLDPICNINLNLLYVKGRSDLVLRLEIIKKTIAISILVLTSFWGIKWMCVGNACYGVIATLLNTRYTGQFIGLNVFKQIKQIAPYYLLALFMAFSVFGFSKLMSVEWLQLLIGIPIGIILYLGLAFVFKMEALNDLVKIIKRSSK